METNLVRFLLIFRDALPESYKAMSAEQRQQLLESWNDWYEDLAAQGKVQHGHPLEPESRLVSGAGGERIIDGLFGQGKEAIGGYFLLTVASLDEATEIAQHCPNLQYGMIVEVRQISECCHLQRSKAERNFNHEFHG